jgi:radical SAM superfamily enzyme YgiQ (UPF0313 family)
MRRITETEEPLSTPEVQRHAKGEKLLLALLPFWTPLIPPMGISCLKSYLTAHGYEVVTADANVDDSFRQIYDNYFQCLETIVPQHKRGNFYNTGIDILQNHMTAHIHYHDEEEYYRLLEQLVYQNFFCPVNKDQLESLTEIIAEFYNRLELYLTTMIQKEQPDIVGFSVFKGALAASLFGFQFIKKKWSHMRTIMGGGIFADQLAVGSPNFQYFIQNTPYIDHIIVGEGEQLLLKLLKGELPNTQKVFTLKDIELQTLDLSQVNVPDFTDFSLEHYPEIAAFTSRSCPFQCGFCAETVNWGKYRKKSAAQVVRELSQLHQGHGAQLFLMSDSLLNPIVEDLSSQLAEHPKALYWDGYLRADKPVCNIDNTIRWRKGGFYRARLGLESGSPHVLKLMDKRITPEQIKEALYALAEAGIKTSTYWVIGFPGETEEDFQHTLDLITAAKDNIYEAECNPFRFYLSGQVQSGQWGSQNKSRQLYPSETRDMLILQTWVLEDTEPSRQEIYSRVNRFVEHCRSLGVPNPYSWQEIHQADLRWQHLHPNAGPPLVQLKDRLHYIDDRDSVRRFSRAEDINNEEDGDFIL